MLKKVKKILYRSLENKEISYKKLNDMLQKSKDIVLLDVRSRQEYKEEHLEGAMNIPLYELENQLKKLPDKEKTVIIYCASGHRSKQAKEKLESLGYKKIYHLKNGLDGI